MNDSILQKQEVLKRTASLFLQTQSNRTSLISVTRVILSPDGAYATIYVSILPNTGEQDAINFLKRQRKELKEYIKKHTKMGRIPFIEIELDLGEKNRQVLDEISVLDRK